MLSEEIAVSMLSIPASAALRLVAVESPVVAWHCMWIGIARDSFSRLTSSKAT
jgi:hypothetical protein